MSNNAQQSIDKLIVALTQLRDSDMLKFAALRENADSARVVPMILDKIVTAVDATAVGLAFHAGLDGAQFNPCLLESLGLADFSFHCNEAADERDEAQGAYVDFVRENSTLHRAAQEC